jgi:DNA (cytosine-5)-methyltransferase 1
VQPIVLDLFCGAGGASKGYAAAGFRVVGVDIEPQPNYPFEFYQADAIAYLDALGHHPLPGYEHLALIHASPPCQAYSLIAAGGVRRKGGHPELVEPIRLALQGIGIPYVIENVPQAPLADPITLCGTSFGLPIIRHRSFECSFPVDAPSCGYKPTARNRHKGYLAYPYGRKSWQVAWREHVIPAVWPWMTVAESGQAIPPAYTEHIGAQLLVKLDLPLAA